jgi:peroxiredoxin
MTALLLLPISLLLALSGACTDEPARAESPRPTSAAAGSAQLGKPAPDFALPDLQGKVHRLSELKGKTVVLEWFNPDCPFVKSARGKGPLSTLPKERSSDKLVWLSINSGAPGKQGHGVERNRAAVSEYGIANPVLLDESGLVGRAYGAEKTPHMFVIDARGTLVYRGGLDNAPMGVVDEARPRPKSAAPGALARYVADALDAVGRGAPIELADTPAYGCSVKYGQ